MPCPEYPRGRCPPEDDRRSQAEAPRLHQHHQIERAEAQERLRVEGGLHSTRNQSRVGLQALDQVSQREVVRERHACCGNAHYVPTLLVHEQEERGFR